MLIYKFTAMSLYIVLVCIEGLFVITSVDFLIQRVQVFDSCVCFCFAGDSTADFSCK